VRQCNAEHKISGKRRQKKNKKRRFIVTKLL